jgi:AraC-like DNA-binding protein
VDRPFVSIRYIAELVQLLREEGADPRDVLRGTGLRIAALEDPDTLLTNPQQLRVYKNALALSREPGLGLRLGSRFRLGHHGVLGHAILCAQSVREALRIIVRYGTIRGSLMRFQLREEAGVAILGAVDAVPLGALHQMMAEEFLAMFAQPLPGLDKSADEPLQVLLDYPAPAHRSMYEQLFDCPIRFGTKSIEIHLPSESLDVPLEMSDAEMARVCEERCEMILARLGAAGGFVDRVRAELLAGSHRFPDLDTVARMLAVSPRTLCRRLEEEGSSFRMVLSEVRKSLALDYLESSDLPLEKIAALLGYEDAANFSRAFRRWVGQAPGRYRRRTRESLLVRRGRAGGPTAGSSIEREKRA